MRKLLLLISMIWLLSPVIHAAYDESDGNFYLMTGDGNETYTVDGNVIFKAYKTTPSTWRDCGVTFLPKNPGEVIVATVQNLDLPSGAGLLVYNDNIDAIKDKIGKSGASSGLGYNYMPAGWCAELKPGSPLETYTSADANGGLSFGWHCTSFPSSNSGFTILVQSVVPKDMEYKSSVFTPTTTLTRGGQDALLGTLTVTTEGLGSPLTLTEISAGVSGLEGQGVENIRLCSKPVATSDNVLATATDGLLDYLTETVLASGDNKYYLIGDLPADFTGELRPVSNIAVAIDDDTYQVASDGASTVENVINMPAGPLTYVIGDDTEFYDDGGKDGKISANFNGSVTFVPADPEKKIRVDFSKLAIFYNSSAVSVGNQDVFKFYDGRVADEANLIATLTDEATFVKSTAEDGSMTVTLASKTAYPADGWEAVVSQFVPGDMTVKEVSSLEYELPSVSSYDTDCLATIICVKADNTLNPLSLENVGLTVTGDNLFDNFSVYSLGQKNVLSTTNKLESEYQLTDGNIAISLSGAQLKEGENYFAVMFDMVKTASNGDKLSLTPKNVKVGPEVYEIPDVSTVESTVVNAFYHHVGTDGRDIHDVWQFNSTGDPVSSTKHLLSTEDCVVTFVPKEAAKCIIDFSEFDLYYSSSAYYGTRAKFEVYSGRTADPAFLLWKLDTNGGKPSGTLKSEADDGSVTVVFNANTTSSYYAGAGWKATVNPFINHDMIVESVAVSQSSVSAIMPGAISEAILDLDIKTEGTLDYRKLKGVTVGLKNSRETVSRVSVMATDAEGAVSEIGSAEVADEDEVTVPCDLTLAEGMNSFKVAYDLKADVAADAVIDGKIVKITTDAGDYAVTDGDPEGERVVKYQYLMSEGDHVVTVGQPIHFYDDGGADGILSKSGLKGSVTFQPADPAKKIRVTVVSYKTAATAILDFYSGRAVSEVSLGQCKQSTYPELPMVSAAEDGAMFVNVACNSYSYGTYDGWDMIVEQYEPGALHFKNVKAENAAAEKTVRGATDALMTKLTAAVDGDFEGVGISRLSAEITATDISDVKDVKLWYTDKNDGFTPVQLVATAVPSADGKVSLVAETPGSAEVTGDYFYWLTASVAPEAVAGNEISISVSGVETTDGRTFEVNNVSPQSTVVKAGFAGGEYVIGASADADYATFADAVAAMDGAIEGPVKFLVEPGTYAEDIKIDNIQGTSETNTITITAQSGETGDVILTGKGYVDGGYAAAKYGVVTITNSDWVTLDRMTIAGKVSGSTEYPYYVNLVGHSRHNTISNCSMTAATSATYRGLNMIYNSFPQGEEGAGLNPDYLTVKDSYFKGGYVAVYIQGSQGYVRYPHMKGLTVTGNTFEDVGSKCVYSYQIEDVLVSGNEMTAGTAVTKTSYYAIDAVRVNGDVDICNNRITNNQTVYSGGIEIRGESAGTAERPIRIYNNTVALTASPSTSGVGVTITSDCKYIDLVHNSINIEGSDGIGVQLANSSTGLNGTRLMNNAVRVNVTGTTASYAFSLTKDALLPKLTFANNAFYSTDRLSNLGSDVDAWGAKTGDETLINEEPKFISSADLHLAEAGSMVGGTQVDYVAADADGVARAEVPTIGAYEFSEMSQDKPVLAEGYPTVSNITYNSARVTTNWSQSGKMHYVALKVDAEAPDAETLLAAASRDAVADTDLGVTLTGLEQQTGYKVYMLLEGANGQNSDVEMAEFTTLRYIEPLEVMLESEWDDATVGAEVEIIPGVTGGDEPYTYVWTNRMGQVVGEEETLAVTASQPEIYTLTVTSADGQTGKAFTSLKVYGCTGDATFEDNLLEPESYWYGMQDDDLMTYHFFSGAFSFSNMCMPSYSAWGGFAYSNCTGTSFTTLFPDQFNNVTGHGYNSDSFAMLYTMGSPFTIEVLASEEGVELDAVYITNSAYTANNILNGDGFSSAFTDGDYYKVIFSGDDEDGYPVEVYLADYQGGQRLFVNDWQKVDLSPLGKNVKKITVKAQASNVYVPTYVALDNLTYKSIGSGVETVGDRDFDASEVVRARVIGTDGAIKLSVGTPGRLIDANDLRPLLAGVYMIEYMLSDGCVVIRKVVK